MNADESSLPDGIVPDEFEARLASAPLRPAPPNLRSRVLEAAMGSSADAAPGRLPSRPPNRRDPGHGCQPAGIAGWIDRLLVRFPLATVGLAACWGLIWFGNSVDPVFNGGLAVKPTTVSREQMSEARVQRAELRQLVGLDEPGGKGQGSATEPPQADAPAGPARPRSDRRRPRDQGLHWVPCDECLQLAGATFTVVDEASLISKPA